MQLFSFNQNVQFFTNAIEFLLIIKKFTVMSLKVTSLYAFIMSYQHVCFCHVVLSSYAV
jgi:hypothetical protein